MVVDAYFSEPVTGLTLDDFAVTGGDAIQLTGGPEHYTVIVKPTSAGSGTIQIPAAVAASESSGRDNQASNVATFEASFVFRPTLTILEATINEIVVLLSLPRETSTTVNALVFTGNNVGFLGSTKETATTYRVRLRPIEGAELVELYVPPGRLTADDDGELSIGSNRARTTLDWTPPVPTIALAGTDGSRTVTGEISWNVPVVGFDISMVDAGNANLYAFDKKDDQTYEIALEAVVDGSVSVAIPAGIVFSKYGVPNEAGAASMGVDAGAPIPILSWVSPDPSPSKILEMTAGFAEKVSSILGENVTVQNGSIASITREEDNPTLFRITIAAENDGQVAVTFLEGAVRDLIGNDSLERSHAIVVDTIPPGFVISGPDSVTPGERVYISITTNEIDIELELADITVTGGSKVSLTGGPTNYTLEVLVDSGATGNLTTYIAPAIAYDNAGNASQEATHDIPIIPEEGIFTDEFSEEFS